MVEETQEQATATRTVTLRALPLGEAVAVGTLAERMQVDPVQVIKQLMRTGVLASINEVIDFDTASSIARAFGFAARKIEDATSQAAGSVAEDDSTDLQVRPPVVTILGHVDHGKTTVLDAIRKTNVAAKEAGGITQHIGAYQIEWNSKLITFIDTPGHAAFTAMRARGAQVTDIAILVVAADDGVMPQTIEAINHIKAADVPMVVAINKMDSTNADAEKVRRQLSEREVLVEKWGGDIIDVEVSGKTGDGLNDLLESILLVAEVAELKANPNRPGVGVVVESRMDKSRGILATILVQTGILRVGDHLVVSGVRGRVKALVNDGGQRIASAGPSLPVEVLGLNDLPAAGDRLVVVADEKTARDMVVEVLRRQDIQKTRGTSLEEVGSRVATGEAKELALVVKTDVHGSLEAVRQALEELSTPETQVRIIHAATGAITESDVLLAVASKAVIVGFNTGSDQGAQRLATQDNVQIRSYTIIYRLTEDIEAALHGMVAPTTQDITDGTATVRAVFALTKSRASAGCYVTDGKLVRNAMARVIRGGDILFDGPILNLRRFKDDVREVATGYECGLSIDGFNTFAEGDTIEVHRLQKVGT
jgi:translation initiation factor IF-2